MSQVMQMLQQAVGLHQSGQLSEALSMYDAVLKKNPKQPDALHLKGVVRMMQGDYDNAEKLMQKALKHNKTNPAVWGNLGATYLGKKRYNQALDAYTHAVKLSPQYAEGYQGLGIASFKLGDIPRAKKELVRATALNAHLPQCYYHLGLAYQSEHDFDSAQMNLKKALKLAPKDNEPRLAYGIVLMQTEQLAKAKKVFKEMYEDGVRSILMYVNYARVLMLKGELDASRAMIEEGYNAYPEEDRVLVLYTLLHKTLPEDNVAQTLLKLYPKSKKNTDDRKRICLGLSRVFENAKSYEESLTYLLEAGRIRRGQIPYDAARMEAFFKSMKDTFTPELVASLKEAGAEDMTPVFILGMPRSGTTLTEQILSTHADVYAAGELDHLQDVLQIKDSHGYNLKPLQEWGRPITAKTLQVWAERYLIQMRSGVDGAQTRYITDKMPSNAVFLGFIKLMFPKAKIIHCARSGLATCLSCLKQDFTYGQGYSFTLEELADYYLWHEDLMAHWKYLFPGGFYTSQYENLVKNQAEETEKLFAYLELDVPENAHSFHETKRNVMTASATQVRQPMYASSLKKWERYGEGLAPLTRKIAHLEPVGE